ncbi:MAG: SDR family oxidoreductase [Candidatus Zixiibacteriota bacterium]|nr:MAG: SDR family oxidoreductase [candidate division Zixibacteria bacterium]
MANHRPEGWHHEPVNVEGKNVIISGGTTGIGRAAMLLLASLGARVLIFGRHDRELMEAYQEGREAGEVFCIKADQSRPEEVKKVFAEADTRLGPPDILINNAGLGWKSIEQGRYGDWEYIVKTNLMGYMACAREAIVRMDPRGEGHIVNVGSMSADLREPGYDVYVATKGAIQAWSESLRKEVNGRGIRVTLIEPGQVGTDMKNLSVEEQYRQMEERKMLSPEDVAETIHWCLVQPPRCDIVQVQLRPVLQLI